MLRSRWLPIKPSHESVVIDQHRNTRLKLPIEDVESLQVLAPQSEAQLRGRVGFGSDYLEHRGVIVSVNQARGTPYA